VVKAILACDNSGGVSKDGTIPWPKNKKDLGWFKKNTTNNVVVMGSKTWVDPLMPWPLPNRINVLATSRKDELPGADKYVYGDLNGELKALKEEYPSKTIWVIGGPNTIKQTLESIEEFYLSKIPGDYDCDGFLSLKDIETLFKKTWFEKHESVEFQIWKKIK
jgi:dihydrofolate reductase